MLPGIPNHGACELTSLEREGLCWCCWDHGGIDYANKWANLTFHLSKLCGYFATIARSLTILNFACSPFKRDFALAFTNV